MGQARATEVVDGGAGDLSVPLHGGEGILYLTIDDGTIRTVYTNDDVPRLLDMQDLFALKAS